MADEGDLLLKLLLDLVRWIRRRVVYCDEFVCEKHCIDLMVL